MRTRLSVCVCTILRPAESVFVTCDDRCVPDDVSNGIHPVPNDTTVVTKLNSRENFIASIIQTTLSYITVAS